MIKVAIGGGSCQVLVELDQVPKVGDTITIPEENVVEASGFGMGLVGVPILVTDREDEGVEIEGKMVPRIWARTIDVEDQDESGGGR